MEYRNLRAVRRGEHTASESQEFLGLRRKLSTLSDTAADATKMAAAGILLSRAAMAKRPTKSAESTKAWVDDHAVDVTRRRDPYPRSDDLRQAVLGAATELDGCADEDSAMRRDAYQQADKALSSRSTALTHTPTSLAYDRGGATDAIGWSAPFRLSIGPGWALFGIAAASGLVGYYLATRKKKRR